MQPPDCGQLAGLSNSEIQRLTAQLSSPGAGHLRTDEQMVPGGTRRLSLARPRLEIRTDQRVSEHLELVLVESRMPIRARRGKLGIVALLVFIDTVRTAGFVSFSDQCARAQVRPCSRETSYPSSVDRTPSPRAITVAQ